jgi:hypothetical protein
MKGYPTIMEKTTENYAEILDNQPKRLKTGRNMKIDEY